MLGRGWEPARATIVAARATQKPVYTGRQNRGFARRIEYVLDVQPAGGRPMFRATLLSPLNVDTLREMSVGEVVPVQCNPKSQDVKFDKSDPSIRRDTVDDAQRDSFDAIRNAAPGTAASTTGPTAQGPLEPETSRSAELGDRQTPLVGDRSELNARREARPPGRVGGSASDRSELKARLEARVAGGVGGVSDPVERLKELADLRDRGVITDEELQAQKRKLLGSA